jgi:hypothetical protein
VAIIRVPPIKLLEDLPKVFLSWLRDLARSISFGGNVGQGSYSVTTTDATPTVVWELDIPEKSIALITFHAMAIYTDALAVQSQRASVFAYRTTGSVLVWTQVDSGADKDHFYIGTLAAKVAMSGSATQVQLKATGVAAQTWKWQGYVEYSVLAA